MLWVARNHHVQNCPGHSKWGHLLFVLQRGKERAAQFGSANCICCMDMLITCENLAASLAYLLNFEIFFTIKPCYFIMLWPSYLSQSSHHFSKMNCRTWRLKREVQPLCAVSCPKLECQYSGRRTGCHWDPAGSMRWSKMAAFSSSTSRISNLMTAAATHVKQEVQRPLLLCQWKVCVHLENSDLSIRTAYI